MSEFDEYTYDWMDPYGSLSTLHAINPVRLSFLQSVCNLNDTLDVLDLGCGGGIFTFYLDQHHPSLNITGIDSAKKAIHFAKKHAENQKRKIQFTDQSALKPFNKTFDIIVCFELIEHLSNPNSLIENIRKHLKPNGYLALSTIDRTMMSFIQNIVIAEHVLEIVPRGTHSYKDFIRPNELIEIAKKHNLQPTLMNGLYIDPITYTFEKTDDIKSNYFVAFQNQV
ncbi:MAG: 3-demethylubiquinone-9 3-O-methyltransferase [Legionellales bacterium]|nr:3-demethylubiquinone-9 3-O-methyltransferase [Legionellales bacterium]OUX64274.1 MAG: 3-demethylubiquinone-9 3-O-methyltransferase [Gammaproteobacteria bacterium TMED281]|tara:strand:+ start:3043 stop:3717 length:675 start_codon:yes stop_codon:yes gene_type:complete